MKMLIAIFFVISSIGCSSNTLRSEDVVAKLELEGKPYFRHLVDTRQYESLLDSIENGDEVLIRNSYLLSQWADASTSLSLKYALSRAVTRKPDAVMGLIPKYFSVSDICTVPYIEETPEVELSHVTKSLSALGRSPKAKSNSIYRQCIDIYKKIKRNITIKEDGEIKY